MNIEKQNDPKWQDALDSLECLPDQEPLDKALAWEKLYARLEAKSDVPALAPDRSGATGIRFKRSRYWLAAAILLCIATATGIGIRMGSSRAHSEKIVGGAEGVPQATAVGKEASPTRLDDRKTFVDPPVKPISGDENKPLPDPAIRFLADPGIRPITSLRIGSAAGSGIRPLRGVAISRDSMPMLAPHTIDLSVSNQLLHAGPMQVRKNRAVLSLNELEASPAEETGIADADGDPGPTPFSFKIKLYNPAKITPPAVAEQEGAPSLPKIRLSGPHQN